MAETKGNRNAQELKTSGGFRISGKPLVHITAAEERQDSPDTIGLPRKHGARILFAIARDPRTIFASWNIVCRPLLEKQLPVDRQVPPRLTRAQRIESHTITLQSLIAMHYFYNSAPPASYTPGFGSYDHAHL